MEEPISEGMLGLIEQWGALAICLLILLEETGVPLPLPGDLILIWAGYRAALGHSHFVVLAVMLELVTLIGASALYWLASKGGRPLILRYGRYLHIDEAKLARAERFVAKNAPLAVCLGRIIPGLRIATPLASGVFHVPYRVFLPSLAAGALTYILLWMGIGYFFGPGVIEVLHGPRLTARLVWSLLLLVALVAVTWQIRRRVLPNWRAAAFGIPRGRKVEAAALAGFLATLEMATAVGISLTAFAQFHFEGPERALLNAFTLVAEGHGTLLGRAFLPLGTVLFFLAGVLWAIIYGLWAEPRLSGPDWLKGTLFSLLPTLVSWLVVLPVLGAGPLGLGLADGWVPALGELVRHLAYGAALGIAYPVLLLARRPAPARPALVPAAQPAG